MELTYEKGLYRMDNVPDDVFMELVQAGWVSRQKNRATPTHYVTSKPVVASRWHEYATDPKLREKLAKRHVERVDKIRPSFAIDSNIVVPVPEGLALRPYQKAGVAFAVVRERALIADSMRLGKTIQALGAANYWDAKNVLIICPSTARVNWKREYNLWNTAGQKARVVKRHTRRVNGEKINDWLGLDDRVVIINYDILGKHHKYLRARGPWDLIVFDESHYCKNEQAQRTQHCFGYNHERVPPIPSKRYIALDGTPVYTRIFDLWPICQFMDPTGLGANKYVFQKRYCNGHKDADGNWDYSGASNLEELQERMRAAFMIRREKNDVAAEIPPNRQTYVIPAEDDFRKLLESERSAFGETNLNIMQHMHEAVARGHDVSVWMEQISRHDGVDRTEVGGDAPPPEDEKLSSVRKRLALRKVDYVVDYVRELLETRDKVVIMAHHREVVEALQHRFRDMNAVKLYGGMTITQRQLSIDTFREDPACRVFIGNIISAGQAISLAKADDIVFAELSWVPAEMDQAEERIWDVLKEVACNIHRVVVEDSLDEAMAFVLERRQKDITKTLKVRALLDSVGAAHG